MKSPTQIVVRVPANQYAELNLVAEQLGVSVSEMIREMVESSLPRYKQRAAAEGEKIRAGKKLREQIDEAVVELVDDIRRGRLVLFLNQLTAPKALALAEMIQRLRSDDAGAEPRPDELRAALLRALEAAPDVSVPDPPPRPERVRGYRKRKPDA